MWKWNLREECSLPSFRFICCVFVHVGSACVA